MEIVSVREWLDVMIQFSIMVFFWMICFVAFKAIYKDIKKE